MGFWNPRRLRLSPHEHQGSWHEGEWDYLIRQDRFWPGFISAFLAEDWRLESFIGFLEIEYPDAPIDVWLAAPAMFREQLLNAILDGRYEGDGWFAGTQEPFELALRDTPGFFEITAEVNDGDIYYTLTEIVTQLTPEADRMPDSLAKNRDVVVELAENIGATIPRFLINRG